MASGEGRGVPRPSGEALLLATRAAARGAALHRDRLGLRLARMGALSGRLPGLPALLSDRLLLRLRLYLDAPRLRGFRLGQSQRQDAVLEGRVGLVGLDLNGEREAPLEPPAEDLLEERLHVSGGLATLGLTGLALLPALACCLAALLLRDRLSRLTRLTRLTRLAALAALSGLSPELTRDLAADGDRVAGHRDVNVIRICPRDGHLNHDVIIGHMEIGGRPSFHRPAQQRGGDDASGKKPVNRVTQRKIAAVGAAPIDAHVTLLIYLVISPILALCESRLALLSRRCGDLVSIDFCLSFAGRVKV